MRKSRFSETQIVAILREFDAGAQAEELARRHGIHANTIRLWRSKYAVDERERSRPAQAARGRERTRCSASSLAKTVKIDAMEEVIRKNSWSLRGEPKP